MCLTGEEYDEEQNHPTFGCFSWIGLVLASMCSCLNCACVNGNCTWCCGK